MTCVGNWINGCKLIHHVVLMSSILIVLHVCVCVCVWLCGRAICSGMVCIS